MYRYRLEYLKDTGSHGKLDGEHQVIYESIKNGDREAVRAMVGQHIDNQKAAILAAIRENEKKKREEKRRKIQAMPPTNNGRAKNLSEQIILRGGIYVFQPSHNGAS